MTVAQTLLLSALLLVAISHAQPDIGKYLHHVAFDWSKACQLKYQSCGGLQTSDDYCSQVKNAKQCATTGSVQTNDSIAVCADTEYQRALDVACMTAEERKIFFELIDANDQFISECKSVISNCFGRFVPHFSLKKYCKVIKEADACLTVSVSNKQSCKEKYEKVKALACAPQNIPQNFTQNITQNITFLMLACVLNLISRDVLVK